jgi:hypothetical protein
MKLRTVRHAFDGFHFATFGVKSKHQAGKNRAPVDQNSARAALAQLTSMFRAGQPKVFAQDLEQRLVRRESNLGRFTVKRE